MTERRWPLVVAAIAVAVVIAGAAWVVGRAGAPDMPPASDDDKARVQSAIRTIGSSQSKR